MYAESESIQSHVTPAGSVCADLQWFCFRQLTSETPFANAGSRVSVAPAVCARTAAAQGQARIDGFSQSDLNR